MAIAAERTGRVDVAQGRRRASKVKGLLRYRAGLVLGAVAAGAAWYFLVRSAIGFGRVARAAGDSMAWALTAAAGVGAACCLLLLFVLVARLLVSMRLLRPDKARRSSGGHRASR